VHNKVYIPKLDIEYVVQSLSETYDWGLIDLNIPEFHKKTHGENINICVIDSGKSEHFEVENRIKDVVNFSDSNTEIDKTGHCTFTSGIIASEINNTGIIGVAPKANLYLAKAIGDGGNGNPSWLAKSINWAIDKKVDIISISAGLFFDYQPLHDAVINAFNNGIITVAAVGNSANRYDDVAYPARYSEVIGVAAYDHNHKIASFSSRGINIAFAMPGVDVYSCWLQNQYVKASGTSHATPVMAGICALIMSYYKTKNININSKNIMEYLKKYSRKLEDLDKNLAGFGTVDLNKIS
jgi:subtilisin